MSATICDIEEDKMRRRKRIVYLAGAIDDAADRGLGWRKEFMIALAEIGVGAIIPNEKEEQRLPSGLVSRLKAKKNLEKFRKLFRKHIMLPDLAAMDACDMVVVRWDGEAIAGTAHECGRAFMRGQPVLLVSPRPFSEVPNWLLACTEMEFHTLDALIDYLKEMKLAKKRKKMRE
jgi:nucleoside 2-deoxyribosyltransferase